MSGRNRSTTFTRKALLLVAIVETVVLVVLAAWLAYLYLDRTRLLGPVFAFTVAILCLVALAAATVRSIVVARRRRFRFGLKTLLLGTAALSVALAVAVSLVRHGQQQRAVTTALELVRSHDGEISYSHSPGISLASPIDWTDSRIAVGVTFTGTPLDASQIEQLSALSRIVSVTINNTLLREDAVLRLASFPNLRFVVLENSAVIDENADSSGGYKDITATTIAKLQAAAPDCRVFQSRAELKQWAIEQAAARRDGRE